MSIHGDPSDRFDCDPRECVYVERIGQRREPVYGEFPPEREPELHYAPGFFPCGYGPHKREFVDWRQCGDEYAGLWRGWSIRVFSQEDSWRGRNVVRWYADVRGRIRVHAAPTKERAMDWACSVVDAEIDD